MTAYNSVRFRVKPGMEDKFIQLQRDSLAGDMPGAIDGALIKTGDRTYFALAEVEMPETDTVPPPPPQILAPHVLLLAPRGDPRFTSKRLADKAHAERLLADVRAKGEAA